jgi:two-component system copper resistance phosphate regulon response regulator CusR
MRVLLIENDDGLVTRIREGFGVQGHEVHVEPSHERGRHLAGSGEYDAIIVEVKPPEGAGIETCRQLRETGVTTPLVLVSTPETTSAETVTGLDAGADDFVAMPFDVEELIARTQSVVRRVGPRELDVLSYDELEFDVRTRVARRAGQRIALSPKESALLEHMLRNPERVLSRTELATHIWGSAEAAESNAIEVCVCTLRRKIERDFDYPLIETIVGYGYMLCRPGTRH